MWGPIWPYFCFSCQQEQSQVEHLVREKSGATATEGRNEISTLKNRSSDLVLLILQLKEAVEVIQYSASPSSIS